MWSDGKMLKKKTTKKTNPLQTPNPASVSQFLQGEGWAGRGQRGGRSPARPQGPHGVGPRGGAGAWVWRLCWGVPGGGAVTRRGAVRAAQECAREAVGPRSGRARVCAPFTRRVTDSKSCTRGHLRCGRRPERMHACPSGGAAVRAELLLAPGLAQTAGCCGRLPEFRTPGSGRFGLDRRPAGASPPQDLTGLRRCGDGVPLSHASARGLCTFFWAGTRSPLVHPLGVERSPWVAY